MTASAFVPGSVVPAANSSLLTSASATPTLPGGSDPETAGSFSELVDQAIAGSDAGKLSSPTPRPTSTSAPSPTARTKPSTPGLSRPTTTKFGGRVLVGTPDTATEQGNAAAVETASASARPLATPKVTSTSTTKTDSESAASSHPESEGEATGEDTTAKASDAPAPETRVTPLGDVAGCAVMLTEITPAAVPPTSSSRGEGEASATPRATPAAAGSSAQTSAPGTRPVVVSRGTPRSEPPANPAEPTPPPLGVQLPDTASAATARSDTPGTAETKSVPPGTPASSRPEVVVIPPPAASRAATKGIAHGESARRGPVETSAAEVGWLATGRAATTAADSTEASASASESATSPTPRANAAVPASVRPAFPGPRPVSASVLAGSWEFHPGLTAPARPSMGGAEIGFGEISERIAAPPPIEAQDSTEIIAPSDAGTEEQVSTPRAIPGWDPARVAKGSPRLGTVTPRSVETRAPAVTTPAVVITRGDILGADWTGSTGGEPRAVLSPREVVTQPLPLDGALPVSRAEQGRARSANEGIEIGEATEGGFVTVEGRPVGPISSVTVDARSIGEAPGAMAQPIRAAALAPVNAGDQRAVVDEEGAASTAATSGLPLPRSMPAVGTPPLPTERRASAVPAVERATPGDSLLESFEAAAVEEILGGQPLPTRNDPAIPVAAPQSASGSATERPGTTETTAKPVGRVPEARVDHKSPTREHVVDSAASRATVTTAQSSVAAAAILSRMAAQMDEASVAGPSVPGRRRKEGLEILPTRDRMMAARLRSDVGTSSADPDDGMSEARFANKNAADSGHKLPGGRHSADSGSEGIVARGGFPQRRFTPPAEEGVGGMLATAGAPRAAEYSASTTSTAPTSASHESAIERIHRLESLVTREVSLLRRSDAQSVSMVLRPDRDTELSVWLSQRDGRMEAEIRCERGDFAGLNGQWRQLQEVLADQHVRLLPLREAGQAVAESSSSSGLNLGQRDERSSSHAQAQAQSSGSSGSGDLSNPFGGGNRQRSADARELELERERGGTRPTATRGVAGVAPTRTEPARPARRDHWEFWA